jgi:hypothetical protein
VKTTVEIPDALFEEVRTFASARGWTFRQVVEAGLRHVLQTDQGRKRPFRLRKRTFRGQGLVPGLEWPDIREKIYEGRGG